MAGPRLAIVGCGRMGRTRCEAARALGGEVVALIDPDRARAEALAEGRPLALLRDPNEAPWADLDAVFVCTPPSMRGPVERRAIEAGVAVFAEKPIGLAAKDAIPLLTALAERPVVTAVGYMNRYRGDVERARAALRGRAVLGVAANWVGGPYRTPWWGGTEGSGGPINEQATHLFDLCRHLVGEIVEIRALGRPSDQWPGVSEAAALALRFESGAVGSLFYSCEADAKMIGFRAFTAEEEVHLDGWDFRLRGAEAEDEEPVFVKETRVFLDAVARGSGAQVRSDFADAWRTQAAVDAAQRAIESGRAEHPIGRTL